MIVKAVGIEYDQNSDYTLLVIDTEAAATQADITSFIPTYSRLGDLAKAEMTDIDPELIDAVMTEEYSEVYENMVNIANIELLDISNSKQRLELANIEGLSQEQIDYLNARQNINNKYGANEQFLGNGLAKNIGSPDGMGVIETFSLDKSPRSLGELENGEVLRRVPLTSPKL